MKKALFTVMVILLATGALFASQSWIGLQATGSSVKETSTFTILGVTTPEQEHTATLSGVNIVGTIYPGDSSIGIGFQAGSAKTLEDKRGSSDQDVSGYPLTMNAGVTGTFRLNMTEMIAFELGAGLLYERIIHTYDVFGTDVVTSLDTLSLLTSANLVFHLSDSLALVGGIGVAFPLTTTAKATNGSVDYDKEFEVKGYTATAKIGVALGF